MMLQTGTEKDEKLFVRPGLSVPKPTRRSPENKAQRWKRERKTVYSTEEYAELEAGGPIKDPETVAEAFYQYCDWPSKKTFEKLKAMYEAVPSEVRRFVLGDQDLKDNPVRAALQHGYRW